MNGNSGNNRVQVDYILKLDLSLFSLLRGEALTLKESKLNVFLIPKIAREHVRFSEKFPSQ